MRPWQLNHGICPSEAKGKRVYVKLRNGMTPKEHWAADGRGGCRWTIGERHPFDIVAWHLA
jgi:hypothetical protein